MTDETTTPEVVPATEEVKEDTAEEATTEEVTPEIPEVAAE